MNERTPDRQGEARRLRAQGMSGAAIAKRLGVSRQSVWRWCRAEAGVEADESGVTSVTASQTPRVAETDVQAHDGVLIDWPTELTAAVARLRSSKSATATAQLAKLALAEIRAADPCENHLDAGEANAFFQAVNVTWASYLQDAGARRLAHILDVRYDTVVGEMGEIVDHVSDSIERLRLEAQEGG